MLIKIGGGDPNLGQAGEGIHRHMNIANKITYYASDERRQVIPYVRVENISTGAETPGGMFSPMFRQQSIAPLWGRRSAPISNWKAPWHFFTST